MALSKLREHKSLQELYTRRTRKLLITGPPKLLHHLPIVFLFGEMDIPFSDKRYTSIPAFRNFFLILRLKANR